MIFGISKKKKLSVE